MYSFHSFEQEQFHVSKHKHKITNHITKLVSKLECVYYYIDGLRYMALINRIGSVLKVKLRHITGYLQKIPLIFKT